MFNRMGIARLSLMSLFTANQAFAFGGPPLLTDDPGTPGSNMWEINVGVTSELSTSESRFEAPLTDINYGVGERVQLKYEVPFVISKRPDEPNAVSNLGRSMGGVKYRFLDQERAGVSMATYPQVVLKNFQATANENDASTEYLLPVEFQETRGLWEFNQEIGYHLIGNEVSQIFYGGALTYNVRDGLALLSELHGNSTRTLSEDELLVNIGGEVELGKNLNLLLSAGRSLREFNQEPSHVVTYVGMQFKM